MGYHAGWVVLAAEPFVEWTYDDQTRTRTATPTGQLVWSELTELRFDHVTRIQKVVDRIEDAHGHRLAAICFNHVAIERLDRETRTRELTSIAPPMVLCEWEYPTTAEMKGLPNEVVEVICLPHKSEVSLRFLRRDSPPTRREALAHNAILERRPRLGMEDDIPWPTHEEELLEGIRFHHHIILDPPMLWEPAATVSRWYDEAEAAGSPAFSLVAEDPTARALFNGWRAALREWGRADLRILFLFPLSGWST